MSLEIKDILPIISTPAELVGKVLTASDEATGEPFRVDPAAIGGGGSGAVEDLTTTETEPRSQLNPNGAGGVVWNGLPFTAEQEQRLRDSVFVATTISFGVTPTSFEKGLETDIETYWTVTENDDSVDVLTVNGITQALLSDSNTDPALTTLVSTLLLTFDSSTPNVTRSATSTARNPQWCGSSTNDDVADDQGGAVPVSYAALSVFTKFISSSDNKTASFLAGNYAYFISINSAATITDGVDSYSVGSWGDGVSHWYKKSYIQTLADGTTITLYVYRTRLIQLINFTYILS